MERQNLERVRDEETREANVVEDTKQPHKGNLGETGRLVGVLNAAVGHLVGGRGRVTRVLVDGADNGPDDKREHHTGDGEQEERATTDLVDGEGSGEGDDEIHDGLTRSELYCCQYILSEHKSRR